MSGQIASYAIACDRNLSICDRCLVANKPCVYSRRGIIRRNRKRKHESTDNSPDLHPANLTDSRSPLPKQTVGPESAGALQSHLSVDIEGTRERLLGRGCAGEDGHALSALSSLSEACAAVWHGELTSSYATEFDRMGKKFFPFEQHAAVWTETFATTLHRGQPLLLKAPPDVIESLRAARPQQVRDRAWLVMYYSIVLSMVTSTDPSNEDMKAKLRCNLWLALNDVRILLEPSDANIQALTILSSHVEEFTTPSMSWMLATTACRMFQALGVNSRRLDPKVRERRQIVFWHLNILDKGLAFVFGRPPTFHRAMAREVELPKLNQLVPFRPHSAENDKQTPVLFGAHFIRQLMKYSRLLGELWPIVYEAEPDERRIESACREVDAWRDETMQVLEASAIAERPLLEETSATSIDLGLRTLRFYYNYTFILLTRASPSMRHKCLSASKEMLCGLDDLVSDSEEPFNGIIWQMVCCPFTPFLVLFGEILAAGQGAKYQDEALDAMDRLPKFLRSMAERNSLAAKLQHVAVVIMEHARSIVRARDSGFDAAMMPVLGADPSFDMFWDAILNTDPFLAGVGHNGGSSAVPAWTTDLFGDMMSSAATWPM